MASASATSGVSLKPIEVPKPLQDGEKFIKWDEESGAGTPVTLRVDPKGFYLYWTDQNMEVELLDMATVRDVRTGNYAKLPKDAKMRNLVTMGPAGSLEDKTVSVCHGTDFVNVTFINFCCAKKEIAQMWCSELFSLAYNLNQLNLSALRCLEKLHAKIVLRADKNGKIPIKNVVRMFASSKEDKRRVEKALSEAGLPSGKTDLLPATALTFEEFFTFYKCLTQRQEVHDVFFKLSEGKSTVSLARLVEFLNVVQRDPRLNEILHPYADLQRAGDLMRAHETSHYHHQHSQLSADGFLRFLMSEDNPAVSAARLEQQELDQPLAHYFINSSHNTYLTGHQITGKSSVEIYRQTLLAGCRCVELDFWNGRTEEPVIVHGYTFVPEVPARDVLEAIAEAAFKTSECPVILSFENHCNPRQQAKIAHYCREIFGDMLLDRPLDSHPLHPGGELPPPSLLKRKIIIKNKKKHHHHHKREPTPRSSPPAPAAAPASAAPAAIAPALSLDYANNGDGPNKSGEWSTPLRLTRQSSTSSSSSSSSSGDEEACGAAGAAGAAGVAAEAAAAAAAEDAAEEQETHAGAEISALVNYVQPVHFSSFENAEKKNRFYEMSSFDEKQATTLLKERPIEFVNYNKQQLSRVYPAGTRVKSTNFMPQLFWNAGCQLVALNFQTLDLSMMLNLGVFEYGRRCGYLLKPEFMRRKDRRLDPFAESTVDGIIAGSLSVAVVSGQLLTDRRVGTYVEVELFGLPADTVRKRFRTRVVPNNGINPVYGDEHFVFKKVVLPELALLRLAAHEEGGRLLGHRVLPLVGLCPGWRHVALRTEAGLPLPATLLLQVSVSDYVPDQLSELAEALANPIKYQSELDRREHQLRVLTEETEADAAAAAPAAPAPAAPAPAPPAAAAPPPPPPAAGPAVPAAAAGNGLGAITGTAGTVGAVGATTEAEENGWLTALLECRAARDKRCELARKLDQLRRKHSHQHHPPKFYVPNRLVKRLSNKNIMSEECCAGAGEASGGEGATVAAAGAGAGVAAGGTGGAGGALAAAERALRLRYHHVIHAALEKHLRLNQQHQMKELQEQLEAEKKEVLCRLAAARKEGVRELTKRRDTDKDERERIKREIHKQSVERGVAECSRLEAGSARRREALARHHERARDLLQRTMRQELVELEALYGGDADG